MAHHVRSLLVLKTKLWDGRKDHCLPRMLSGKDLTGSSFLLWLRAQLMSDSEHGNTLHLHATWMLDLNTVLIRRWIDLNIYLLITDTWQMWHFISYYSSKLVLSLNTYFEDTERYSDFLWIYSSLWWCQK